MRLLVLGLVTLICSACSYQWGNRSELLPGKHSVIAVPIFKNQTQEVGSEVYFTNAMIEEIIRSSGNTITSQDKAEVVLEGEIQKVSVIGEGLANIPTLPAYTELVSNYRLLVEVNIRVRRKADQSILFSESFVSSTTFSSAKVGDARFNSANPNYNQSALHENLKVISKDMMARAYNLMTESF